MKKYTCIKVQFLFMIAFVLIIVFSCKKEEVGPSLVLADSLATGTITCGPGAELTFEWTATKGDAGLSTFSIDLDGSYLSGWDEYSIYSSSSSVYTDEVIITAPESEGSYVYTFMVADENGLGAKKTLTVIVDKAATVIPDAFIYTKDSEFLFVIKDGTSTIKSTLMTWTVTDYDESNQIATISNVLDDESTTIPLPGTFYFRKADNGALEYSSNKSTWTTLTDVNGSVAFLFGTKAASPSSLLGYVVNEVEKTTVSYPDGSSDGVKVSSEYDNSGNDSYLYTDYTKEYYSEDVGFIKSTSYTYDGSDFPAWTYKREVELVSYTIYQDGGTTLEGGSTVPDAPSGLTASYTYKDQVYVFDGAYSGHYETRSYVTLRWTDNSDNEIEFAAYISTDGTTFEQLTEIESSPLTYDNFSANSMSGKIRRGYYVTWPAGTYYFKLKAVSAIGESDFSDVASITAY